MLLLYLLLVNIMNKKNMLFIYIVFILILDQISKYFVYLYKPNIILIKKVLSITYAKNNGIAFSMLSENRFFIILISFVLISLFLYIIYKDMKKDNNKFKLILYAILLGGILGNLLDRLIRGYVIDFISIKIFTYYFPVFNLADICITVGVILLIIYMLFIEKENKA